MFLVLIHSAYMSPEFIERQVISHKCDIYSLGVIIIKLITGERLYSGHFDMSSDRFIELVSGSTSTFPLVALIVSMLYMGYSIYKVCIPSNFVGA